MYIPITVDKIKRGLAQCSGKRKRMNQINSSLDNDFSNILFIR